MVCGHLTVWVEIFDACREASFSRSRMRPGDEFSLMDWHDFATLGGLAWFKGLPTAL
jgi:hypothetical protein